MMTRAGRYVKQAENYRAFIPEPLPPTNPPIQYSDKLIRQLTRAEQFIARLDGVASILPNPELFVGMYVRREAVLSSQIEGTQSSLDDILQFEAGAQSGLKPKDVSEVVNYVGAMKYGIERLATLPLSNRLIREIHTRLMADGRGSDKDPGQFRRSQNWIGPGGCKLARATFVPPPVSEMKTSLNHLEQFLHDDSVPDLIHCGLVHAQFETIHPFLDGNGRIGRLLVTFLLCSRGILSQPLLYLSVYFKKHRAEYYERLMNIRHEGDWENWLLFFLRGVEEVGREATETATRILLMKEELRNQLIAAKVNSHSILVYNYLFEQPVITAKHITEKMRWSPTTAGKAIAQLVQLNVIRELTGFGRNRVYRFTDYVDMFDTETTPIG